jgi:hypothetical protein
MAHPAFQLDRPYPGEFTQSEVSSMSSNGGGRVLPISQLPDDIFRRKAAAIRVRNVEKALAELEKALAIDFAASSQAARYHLAARISGLIERPDMESHFASLRDTAIDKARSAQQTVLRDYSGRDESYDRRPKAARLKNPKKPKGKQK